MFVLFINKLKRNIVHKTPFFYAATRLIGRPETLLNQQCIKLCIEKNKRQKENPLMDKGDNCIEASPLLWRYVN